MKIGVLLVGETGAGKSTHAEWLSGAVGIAGDGTSSVTMETSAYASTLLPNHYLLDTRGFSDTSEIEDEKVMEELITGLRLEADKAKITHLKVIFCGESKRRTMDILKLIGRFILSLAEHPTMAERGTLLAIREAQMRKGGNLTPLDDAYQEAFHMAKDGGSDGSILSIGYSCVERMNDENQFKALVLDGTFNEDQRIKMGFLFEREIKRALVERIQQLQPFEFWKPDAKCENCGRVSDLRLLEQLRDCHPDFDTSHNFQVHGEKKYIYYHPGTVSWEHTQGVIHSGSFFHQHHRWGCCGAWHDTPTCNKATWSCCKHERSHKGCRLDRVVDETFVKCEWCGQSDGDCIPRCRLCAAKKGTGEKCGSSSASARHVVVAV